MICRNIVEIVTDVFDKSLLVVTCFDDLYEKYAIENMLKKNNPTLYRPLFY